MNGRVSRSILVFGVLLAALACGCSVGTGGRIVVPCEAERCSTTCVAAGGASGACTADACVCRPRVTPPTGATLGLSSGGVIERAAGDHRVSLTIGPAEAASGARTRDDVTVEVGLQPSLDPARALP